MHTLLVNATVHTIDPARPRASAVAIKDGRIAAVGDTEALLQSRERETEVIDLGGRCLIPGFVDAHNHFGPTTLNPVAVDISPDAVADISALQSRIAEAARMTPPGVWIRSLCSQSESISLFSWSPKRRSCTTGSVWRCRWWCGPRRVPGSGRGRSTRSHRRASSRTSRA